MHASDVPRAVAAALSSASALGLTVDDAMVLHDSNRIVVRLLPCDVVARVANVVHQPGAAFEVELARRLAKTESPVAALEPRVEPQISVRPSVVARMTFWVTPGGRVPASRKIWSQTALKASKLRGLIMAMAQ